MCDPVEVLTLALLLPCAGVRRWPGGAV